MTQYFIRRLLLIPPTFLGITILVFTITRFVPGGPIEQMIAEAQMGASEDGAKSAAKGDEGAGGASLSPDQMQQLKEYYGFDKPIFVSYYEWLLKVLQLDLGNQPF